MAATGFLCELALRIIGGLGHRGVIINWHTLNQEQVRFQIGILGRFFDFIRLEDLPSRLARSQKKPFCLITLDDGKLSNATQVAPELLRQGVPAVFYVPTAFLDNGRPLWFDRHAALVRATRGSEKGLDINELKKLPLALLNERLNDACARSEVSVDLNSEDIKAMTWDNARSLTKQGFAIGAHGVTHAILTRETEAVARREIEQSIATVRREIGACQSFAFPNGNYTEEMAGYAVQCGARFVLTTNPTWVKADEPLWCLPRIQLFPGFTAARIEQKLAAAALGFLLKNPDGTGKSYRRRRNACEPKSWPHPAEAPSTTL